MLRRTKKRGHGIAFSYCILFGLGIEIILILFAALGNTAYGNWLRSDGSWFIPFITACEVIGLLIFGFIMRYVTIKDIKKILSDCDKQDNITQKDFNIIKENLNKAEEAFTKIYYAEIANKKRLKTAETLLGMEERKRISDVKKQHKAAKDEILIKTIKRIESDTQEVN